MTKLLLATDGGRGADGAARLARLLSQKLGAELHALVVMEAPHARERGVEGAPPR